MFADRDPVVSAVIVTSSWASCSECRLGHLGRALSVVAVIPGAAQRAAQGRTDDRLRAGPGSDVSLALGFASLHRRPGMTNKSSYGASRRALQAAGRAGQRHGGFGFAGSSSGGIGLQRRCLEPEVEFMPQPSLASGGGCGPCIPDYRPDNRPAHGNDSRAPTTAAPCPANRDPRPPRGTALS